MGWGWGRSKDADTDKWRRHRPEEMDMPVSGSIWVLRKAAAAAAKSLQSCPTLCDPMDSSPPGSSVHRIL